MKTFEVVEIFALIFWSFQLAPQSVENWKRQTTIGLSANMMVLWTLGSVCMGIYSIGGNLNVLFIVQPNLFMVFSILCYAQCFYYDVSKSKGVMVGVLLTCAMVICEVVGGYILKMRTNETSSFDSATGHWEFVLLGACSTLCFGIGYVLQFWMIFSVGFVEGISLPFLGIDMTGAALSIASLLLQGKPFRPASITCYVMVLICDLTIIALSVHLKPAPPDQKPDASTSDTHRSLEECSKDIDMTAREEVV
jgi:uncharacterized protein with PQ loop repeat